jgi:hypothetical protein
MPNPKPDPTNPILIPHCRKCDDADALILTGFDPFDFLIHYRCRNCDHVGFFDVPSIRASAGLPPVPERGGL